MEGLVLFLALLLIFFYLFDVRPRLKSMEERLARLERTPPGPTARESAPAQPQPEWRPSPPSPAPAPSPKKARGVVDLEALIGGRWLNYIGIIALLFGAAFFLKHAFESQWIGETTRILAGIICGAALLAYSQKLLHRGYRFFSEGIAGLGSAILFLSVYSGWGFYRLFPPWVAFAGMVAVSGLTVLLALRRDSERISVLALIGGYLTPMLLSTGVDRQMILFSYLVVLNTCFLVLARTRQWRSLDALSFLGTQFLFWGWYTRFYSPPKLLPTFAFASLFFIQFSALPVIRTVKKEPLSADRIVLMLLNAFWLLAALEGMLWPGHRWLLAGVFAVLAAAHAAAGRAFWSAEAKRPPAASLVYGGLGLTFATLIIAVVLRGPWMTIAFAIEGAALVWSGFDANLRLLRGAGLSLFGLVAFRLATFPVASGPFLWNARFAAFGVAALCFASTIWPAQRRKGAMDRTEQSLFAATGVAANVFFLWALSLEFWDLFGKPGTGFAVDRKFAQQLALSLLWSLYAIVLMLLGVQRKVKALRWQGLSLFGIVVAKVFFHDLSFLQQFYRILSFVVLGLALLITSFLYHRRPPAETPTQEHRES